MPRPIGVQARPGEHQEQPADDHAQQGRTHLVLHAEMRTGVRMPHHHGGGYEDDQDHHRAGVTQARHHDGPRVDDLDSAGIPRCGGGGGRVGGHALDCHSRHA